MATSRESSDLKAHKGHSPSKENEEVKKRGPYLKTRTKRRLTSGELRSQIMEAAISANQLQIALFNSLSLVVSDRKALTKVYDAANKIKDASRVLDNVKFNSQISNQRNQLAEDLKQIYQRMNNGESCAKAIKDIEKKYPNVFNTREAKQELIVGAGKINSYGSCEKAADAVATRLFAEREWKKKDREGLRAGAATSKAKKEARKYKELSEMFNSTDDRYRRSLLKWYLLNPPFSIHGDDIERVLDAIFKARVKAYKISLDHY